MRKEKGFNLIELMIVIAIMATLAAIAIPSYRHYINKGRAMSAVVATQPVRTAVAEYAMMHNGNLSEVSNQVLNLSSQDLVSGSHDLASINIASVNQSEIEVIATLSDQLGILKWTGAYQSSGGNIVWTCSYPSDSPIQNYAPHGCEAV